MISRLSVVHSGVASALILFSGCEATPPINDATQGYVERQRVIAIAERELMNRNLPLPDRYEAEVVESEVIEEARAPRTNYVVTFRRVGRDQSRVYSVEVNKGTKEAEGIEDYRHSPDGVSR